MWQATCVSTVVSPKRGRYARSYQRREQIAGAVLDLVDELGHEGVTTALVASRAGISEPTVLYHFPTKDHLLVAALERADDIDAGRAGADIENQALDLGALREAANSELADHERRVRLLAMLAGLAATPDHPAAGYLARRQKRAVAVFATLIAQRQRMGVAHPGLDPLDVARQVVGLRHGLVSQWLQDQTIDVGMMLADGFRRLAGENWMQARALLNRADTGL
jgi:AcrR family transcriptional regulator